MKNLLLTIFTIFLTNSVFAKNVFYTPEKMKEHENMSIQPVLSKEMRDPSWSIRHWISADKMNMDCKIAHEYMDQGILSKTTSRRRSGAGTTHTIFEYLRSCKNWAKTASDIVSPQAKKWCHYRKNESRLDQLCSEWEGNKDVYIKTIENQYKETEIRFNKITNGYYKGELE